MGGGGTSHKGPYKGQDLSNPFRLVKGDWGNPGCRPQKGITTYGIAPNRLDPLAGTVQAAIFNTFRRTRNQILYWGVPLLIAYQTMQWATERNEYLNSKAGRAMYEEES